MTLRSDIRIRLRVLTALLSLVALLLWAGLHVNNMEAANNQRPEVLPADGGQPVVASLREAGGPSLFGIRITRGARYVEVRFLAPPGCSARLRAGDPWPSHVAECPDAFTIAGTVRGLGTNSFGDSLVGVEFDFSQSCFGHLRRGRTWPPTDPECAQHHPTATWIDDNGAR